MKNIAKTIVVIIVALIILIPFASTYPDGLEKVVESIGIEEPKPFWGGLMPDYTFALVKNSYFTMLISGLVGVFFVCGIAWIMGLMATHENKHSDSS